MDLENQALRDELERRRRNQEQIAELGAKIGRERSRCQSILTAMTTDKQFMNQAFLEQVKTMWAVDNGSGYCETDIRMFIELIRLLKNQGGAAPPYVLSNSFKKFLLDHIYEFHTKLNDRKESQKQVEVEGQIMLAGFSPEECVDAVWIFEDKSYIDVRNELMK
jgi:hypothetical protein